MEWQKIETAPKDEMPILVAYDDGSIELIKDSGQYDWQPYARKEFLWCATPTHWMPLPPPPETGE